MLKKKIKNQILIFWWLKVCFPLHALTCLLLKQVLFISEKTIFTNKINFFCGNKFCDITNYSVIQRAFPIIALIGYQTIAFTLSFFRNVVRANPIKLILWKTCRMTGGGGGLKESANWNIGTKQKEQNYWDYIYFQFSIGFFSIFMM